MSRLKVGIIGCGKMGRVYARWFNNNPHCSVSGFYNRTRSRAEALSKSYKESVVYATWEDMVKNDTIDIVGICTPSHEHLAQFELAVKNEKHVLCEKPMANDIDQCRRMVGLGKKYRQKYMVGFQMRFHPVIEKVNEFLPSIGKIFHIDFNFGMYQHGITWRHKLEEGGGVQKELTSHLFDLCCIWAGDPGAIQSIDRVINSKREVEDYSLNILEFKGGISGFIISNYYDRRHRLIKGNIMATAGQISFCFSPYYPNECKVTLYNRGHKEGKDLRVDMPVEIDEVYPGHLDSFKKEIDHFVECIRMDIEPSVSLEDGLRAIEIVDASYQASRTGTKVKFPFTKFDSSGLAQCYNYFEG